MNNLVKRALVLVLLVSFGCKTESEVKISAEVKKTESEGQGSETNENSGAESSEQSQATITITPKGANAGDNILLGSNISKLVTITNTSSSLVNGTLSISGSSYLELATVENCSYNGESISYSLNANETARFLVVRKSNFSSSISASLNNIINSTTNSVDISTIALGYDFIYWFNPRDLELSNLVSDTDSSGDVSNGDEISSLTDRSGNNFNLNASSSSNYATVVENGENGQRNIHMNGYISGLSSFSGTWYTNTFATLDLPADGSATIYMQALNLDSPNGSERYQWMTYVNGGAATTYYGPDINTSVPTRTGKYGYYANRNAFETTSLTPTTPHIFSLYFPNTNSGTQISSTTKMYFENTLLTQNTSNTYTNGGNQFSTSFSSANKMQIIYKGTIQEMILAKGIDSEEKRLDLLCYLALKNGKNIETCN